MLRQQDDDIICCLVEGFASLSELYFKPEKAPSHFEIWHDFPGGVS